MYLARPSFRPRRIFFALLALPLVFFLAGVLYEIPTVLMNPAVIAVALPLIIVLFLLMGVNTVYYLGFPPIPPVHGEPTNLYPIIVPLVLVLFVFATRTVRLGHRSPDSSADAGDPRQLAD